MNWYGQLIISRKRQLHIIIIVKELLKGTENLSNNSSEPNNLYIAKFIKMCVVINAVCVIKKNYSNAF